MTRSKTSFGLSDIQSELEITKSDLHLSEYSLRHEPFFVGKFPPMAGHNALLFHIMSSVASPDYNDGHRLSSTATQACNYVGDRGAEVTSSHRLDAGHSDWQQRILEMS